MSTMPTIDHQPKHIPVLLNEVIVGLLIREGGTYIDATFGFGGHAQALLDRIGAAGHLIGIEVDRAIYEQAGDIRTTHESISLHHGNFIDVDRIVLSCGYNQVDGILFDLGVNTFQIKNGGRGLSFMTDEPLDMRLDRREAMTAALFINTLNESDIHTLLKNVDEPYAGRIARQIVQERPFHTTGKLVASIEKVVPRRGRIHPATRTFMALRMAVNHELDNLMIALPKAISLLKKGGRLAVITFHSGEDRIVKTLFRAMEREEIIKRVNKKVITPTRTEILANPLSRSAKLRIVEKY